MDRRTFLLRSAMLATGTLVAALSPTLAEAAAKAAETGSLSFDSEAYKRFKNSEFKYHPYVRWWWNGDKVEAAELVRELHLLKEAGIAGVEINPIAFPTTGDDLGKKSLRWLSDEWIDALKVTFDEAKKIGMTCDLLVGSGWPFGSEDLTPEERAQVVLVDAEKIEGPTTFEISKFTIFKTVDPGVTDVNPLRTFEIMSLKLVPNPMSGIDQAIDLSDQIGKEVISVDVPEGKYVFYALVKVNSFACVINGAPGAAGSILNHMDKKAVRKYLDHMADTIQNRIGPLKNYVRAMFTDSMELEGSNWTGDFAEQFRLRRGYDLMPYLPFMMFKVGRLGDVLDYNYGAEKTPEFKAELQRVRFDFELTKAELLKERFTDTYTGWCKDLGVLSRAQAYGRGFFPLESSMGYSIPEGESWTTNWLKHRLGEEMRDDEYRAGRGYTMINKYVSSAAHLTGKRIVSAEEMTNTYLAFRATLELIKIGSDMSAVSGITHSVWHGFNYSPADAPFPGWVQYGSYYNENNTWWPYFKYLNAYKGRLSSQFQNADMYTDMIILPPNYDMWGEIGVQTDPFPGTLNVLYTSLIWEAICKNGGAADYTSEIVLNASTVKNGKLCSTVPNSTARLPTRSDQHRPLDAREDSRVRFPGRPRFLHRKIPVQVARLQRLQKARRRGTGVDQETAGLPRPLYPRQKTRGQQVPRMVPGADRPVQPAALHDRREPRPLLPADTLERRRRQHLLLPGQRAHAQPLQEQDHLLAGDYAGPLPVDLGSRYRQALPHHAHRRQLRTGTRPGRNPLHRLRQSV